MHIKYWSNYRSQFLAALKLVLSRNIVAIRSYYRLRRWIGILGMALPVILIIGGCVQNCMIEGSISSYYYTGMKDFFIGLLFAVGLFLITYKGYQFVDDLVTNLCGIFALGIIAFPASAGGASIVQAGIFFINDDISKYIHLTCAALFFILLSVNSYFLFTKHGKKKLTEKRIRRNRIYKGCAIVMLLSIVCIAIYSMFLEKTVIAEFKPVLVFETIALLAFGTSWLAKGKKKMV
jgi:uncharacterized membrane protein YoaK (UPF0700 family)